MSNMKTRTQPTRDQFRAIVLSAIMVLSMVGMGAAVSPTVAEETDSDSPPDIAASYYGEVTIDGEDAPEGVEVAAIHEGETVGTLEVGSDSWYGGSTIDDDKLTVPESSEVNIEEGDEIHFEVDGETAVTIPEGETEPQTITWEEGDSQQIDLVVQTKFDVDLLEDAPFTLNYADTGAATTVSFDEVLLKDTNEERQEAIKEHLSVFDEESTIEFEFENEFGAASLDDGSAQLVISKLEEPLEDPDDLEDLLALERPVADSYDVVDNIEIEGGSATAEYTFDESGQYIVHFVTLDEGDGFEVANDILTQNDPVSIAGIEQVAIQAENGEITSVESTDGDEIQQGDSIEVDVDSQLNEESVDHALVAYDAETLAEQRFILETNERDLDNIDEDDLKLIHNIEAVRGSVDVDEGHSVFDMVNLGVSDLSFTGTASTGSIFDELFNETDEFDRIDDQLEGDGIIFNASMVSVTDEGPSTTLTIDTMLEWEPGEYELLYVAQADDDLTTLSTASDAFELEPADILPNLETTLEADAEQQLRDGLTANVTVENTGLAEADEFDVSLTADGEQFDGDEATVTETKTVDPLDVDDSTTLEFDLSDFVQADDGERPDGHVVGDVDLEAEANPDDAIDELNRDDNIDTDTVEVTYAKLEADAIAPTSATQGEEVTLRSVVRNLGTATSDNESVAVSVTNETDDVVFDADVYTDNLEAGDRVRERLRNAFDDPGNHTLIVEVDDEWFPGESNSSTDTFEVDAYDLDVVEDRIRVPDEVNVNRNVTTVFAFESNAGENATATLNITDQDGVEYRYDDTVEEIEVEVDPESNRVTVVTYDLTTVEADEVDLEFEVEDTLGIGVTDNVTKSMEVTESFESVSNSTALSVSREDETADAPLGLYGSDVIDEDTQELDLVVQAGADGRTLQGLEYLVRFPYGCVEQTTSAFLGALNTYEYYEDRDYDIDEDRLDVINGSIEQGLERLAPDGIRGQLDDGSWNQWGSPWQGGTPYFTSYALYGMASVQNNEVHSERAENPDRLAEVTFDETVQWLSDNEDEWDGTDDGFWWNRGDGYLQNDYALMGFMTIGLDEANATDRDDMADEDTQDNLDDIYGTVVEELHDNQHDDGYWEGGDHRTTAHALHALQIAYDAGAYDQADDVSEDNLSDAIDGAKSWLITQQDSDGKWNDTHRSFGFRATGDQSETTAAALQALNETGLGMDNDTIEDGVDYLIDVYESGGSWGYTRATQAAIDTLDTLTPDTAEQTVNVTLSNNGEEVEINDLEVNQSVQVLEIDLFDENVVNQTDLQDVLPDDDELEEIEIEIEAQQEGQVIVALEATQDVRESALGGGQ